MLNAVPNLNILNAEQFLYMPLEYICACRCKLQSWKLRNAVITI